MPAASSARFYYQITITIIIFTTIITITLIVLLLIIIVCPICPQPRRARRPGGVRGRRRVGDQGGLRLAKHTQTQHVVRFVYICWCR